MRYADVSRTISHALRHEPWLYELELDDAGWVPVEDLVAAVRAEKPAWAGLSEADLLQMMADAEKQRFEMRDGKFRALYGHSTPQKLLKELAAPPAILFHGTAPKTVALVRKDGLRPMGRQYVHLSLDTATAMQVGRRKAKDPVILRIRAGEAHGAGVPFYRSYPRLEAGGRVPGTREGGGRGAPVAGGRTAKTDTGYRGRAERGGMRLRPEE